MSLEDQASSREVADRNDSPSQPITPQVEDPPSPAATLAATADAQKTCGRLIPGQDF